MTQNLPLLIEPETLMGPGGVSDDSTDVLLVHVAEARAYEQAHIPGSRLVEPRSLVDGRPPAPGNLPDKARLEALLSGLGYGPERHIVVYDDEGGGWAGRFIWTLDVIGHHRWSYLNGGIQAWQAAGGVVTTGAAPAPESALVDIDIDARPVAAMEDVVDAIHDRHAVIWDVRSAEEYRGEKSSSRRAGHIPTAVNLDWNALKDPARQLRLAENLNELLASHGIDPARRVITHCQTHHRSGLSYLVGRLLGFSDIRAYPGAWAEWGNRDDTPVVVGAEPGEPEDGTPR